MNLNIMRKIDELGRVVLPIQIREFLNIETGATLCITFENGELHLSKDRKPTMLRKVDELGRVVLPVEALRALNLREKSIVNIRCVDNEIVVRPSVPTCCICGSEEGLNTSLFERPICEKCLAKARQSSEVSKVS